MHTHHEEDYNALFSFPPKNPNPHDGYRRSGGPYAGRKTAHCSEVTHDSAAPLGCLFSEITPPSVVPSLLSAVGGKGSWSLFFFPLVGCGPFLKEKTVHCFFLARLGGQRDQLRLVPPLFFFPTPLKPVTEM